MEPLKEIKHIAFIDKNQSNDRNKAHMDYWKKEGFVLSDVVDNIKKGAMRL